MTTRTILSSQRVITISGVDRATFLQGQLTQDITTLAPGRAVLAGAADARGRLQFVGYLFAWRSADIDSIALVVPAELAVDLMARLRMHVLRARVQIGLLDGDLIAIADASAADDPSPAIQLPGSGNRRLLIGDGAQAAAQSPAATNEWELAEIRAGIPMIVKATVGEFVPQMVNLDLLGGISFTKGCYTGQEIVARTKYLGRIKRRMLRYSASGPPPPAGTALNAMRGTGNPGVVGQVVRSAAVPAGCEFLAVVSLDGLPDPVFPDEAMARPARRLDLPYDIPRDTPS